MPVCVQVEWKCFQVCLKSTTEVIANLSHPCALCVAEEEEEWERPERQSWPPEQRMPPFGISLLHLRQSSLNLFRGPLGFCSWRIVLLVICILLGISRWWKSIQKEYSDVKSKGIWPFFRAAITLVSMKSHLVQLQLTGLSRHSSYSENLNSWSSFHAGFLRNVSNETEFCLLKSNQMVVNIFQQDGKHHSPG